MARAYGEPYTMWQNEQGYAYHLLEGTIERNVELSLRPRNGDLDELAERLARI